MDNDRPPQTRDQAAPEARDIAHAPTAQLERETQAPKDAPAPVLRDWASI
ncbi:MAG: hypothetical protein AAGP08_00620 [Pseudomonadota bacterium]